MERSIWKFNTDERANWSGIVIYKISMQSNFTFITKLNQCIRKISFEEISIVTILAFQLHYHLQQKNSLIYSLFVLACLHASRFMLRSFVMTGFLELLQSNISLFLHKKCFNKCNLGWIGFLIRSQLLISNQVQQKFDNIYSLPPKLIMCFRTFTSSIKSFG